MLIGGSGAGIVKLLESASNGEPLAYWLMAFFLVYAVVAIAIGVFMWMKRKPGDTRKLLGYSFTGMLSVGFSLWIFFAMLSRLP